MTPQDLIAAFDTLAEAPDGVTHLRELVLELAVCGKLVPSDPEESPVSPEAVDTKPPAGAASGNTLRGHRASNDVKAAATDIRNWVEAPLGSLLVGLLDFRGRTPKKLGMEWGGGTIPALSALNVRDGGIDPSRNKHFGSLALYEKWMTQGDAEQGDVLLTMEAPLGNVAQIPDDQKYILSQRVVLLKPRRELLFPDFLAWSLRSPSFQAQLRSNETGTTAKGIRAARLVKLLVALPPLAEQKRIVARVDELMGLLDRLEAARSAREATRTALRDAALAALRDADTPEEVEVAWERIAGRMDDLFTDPADVDPLRQTVLQLAVRGRLVPQDPNDEPASVLLERIAEEKARLVKEKKIRKPKALPPVAEDEVPFEVPEGWGWTRLEPITEIITSGSRGWNKYYSESGATFIRSQDIKYDRLEYDNRAFVQIPVGSEGTRTRVAAGDWLITITGANVGKCAHLPQFTDEAYVSQHVALVRPVDPALGRLGHFWLTGAHGGRGLLLGESYGAKPGLNLTQLRELPFPVPPQAEQERIVARVDELMGLLDGLEGHLATKTTAHDAFAAAAIHHLDA